MIGSAVGFALALLSFIPLALPGVSRNRQLATAVFLVMLAHNGISFVNAFLYTFPAASMDANEFHLGAMERGLAGEYEIGGSQYFVKWLVLWYDVFGDSIYLGQQLSVVTFGLTLIAVIGLLDILKVGRYRPHCVYLAGLLPPLAIYTSVTMREAYELGGFVWAAYLCVLTRRGSFVAGLMFPLACFLTGIFHPGLQAFGVLYTGIGFLWSIRPRNAFVRLTLLSGAILVALLVGAYILQVGFQGSSPLRKLAEGQVLEYAETHGEGAVDARTNYKFKLENASSAATLVLIPLIFLQYMFSPWPTQIRAVSDLYAFGEGMLRLALILGALAWCRRLPAVQRDIVLFLLFSACLLEGVWAMGTYNWGTAIRHHIVAYPLLVVAGGPWLAHKLFRVPVRRNFKRSARMGASAPERCDFAV